MPIYGDHNIHQSLRRQCMSQLWIAAPRSASPQDPPSMRVTKALLRRIRQHGAPSLTAEDQVGTHLHSYWNERTHEVAVADGIYHRARYTTNSVTDATEEPPPSSRELCGAVEQPKPAWIGEQ